MTKPGIRTARERMATSAYERYLRRAPTPPDMTKWEQKWLRKMHLRPIVVINRFGELAGSGGIYIAIASDLYLKHNRAAARGTTRVYLWDIEHQFFHVNSLYVEYRERKERIVPFTDSQIATEILMGTDIARAREEAERIYGRYEQ